MICLLFLTYKVNKPINCQESLNSFRVCNSKCIEGCSSLIFWLNNKWLNLHNCPFHTPMNCDLSSCNNFSYSHLISINEWFICYNVYTPKNYRIFPFEWTVDVRARSSLKCIYRQLKDKRLDATKELKGSRDAVLMIYILHFKNPLRSSIEGWTITCGTTCCFSPELRC